MPIALAVIGLALIIAGAHGNGGKLATLVGSDLDKGFLAWVAAIFFIGFLGYIPNLQKASRGLLVLIILVYLMGNVGAFAQIAAVAEKPPTPDGSVDYNYAPTSSSSGTSSSGGGILGDVGQAAGIASTLASFF
jgi:hypothetical protein